MEEESRSARYVIYGTEGWGLGGEGRDDGQSYNDSFDGLALLRRGIHKRLMFPRGGIDRWVSSQDRSVANEPRSLKCVGETGGVSPLKFPSFFTCELIGDETRMESTVLGLDSGMI